MSRLIGVWKTSVYQPPFVSAPILSGFKQPTPGSYCAAIVLLFGPAENAPPISNFLK
jgi:hypothetical protein